MLSLISADFVRKNNVMPPKLTGSHLIVAMAEPRRQDIFQALGFIIGLNVDVVVTNLKEVQ